MEFISLSSYLLLISFGILKHLFKLYNYNSQVITWHLKNIGLLLSFQCFNLYLHLLYLTFLGTFLTLILPKIIKIQFYWVIKSILCLFNRFWFSSFETRLYKSEFFCSNSMILSNCAKNLGYTIYIYPLRSFSRSLKSLYFDYYHIQLKIMIKLFIQ